MSYANDLKKWAIRRVQVKRLLSAGMKVPEVAARMKISRQRVYQIANGK